MGFGLGCIIVWATLIKDRERPAWMPEGRVIEYLAKAQILITDEAQWKLDCYAIPSDFMNTDFWSNAKVNFKKSTTDKKPCPEYYISSKLSNETFIIVYIETCELENKASLRNIEVPNKQNCNCD
ncbi:MAG: hypothetical protein COX70_01825 [Flavobacteriales bacterium CG_4_10_14_0_2_um_filter_32_8]|nr:MAG: hypothetical protein COX70_01825 [Flavobacteriales bacterium CG_4_10_14_0_2_um_filter_32_8]PJB15037.1 MAG: hypothetical protein CO118_05515 [Flavobacteriales bacterium CG_4_9_14_3_um_filter_32_8]